MDIRDSASINGQRANITASASTALGIYAISGGTAAFSDHVNIDAPIAVQTGDVGSSVTFADGLSTSEASTLLWAYDGAKISVNSTGAGTVHYVGTTDITGTASDGTLDMTLNGAGSYWYLTGDSRATKLTNNGALLDMTKDGNKFSTLTLADLSGENGWIKMDTGS